VTVDSRVLGNPGTPAFRVEKYPFFVLNRLVGRFNTLIEARLKAVGIDIPYWRVLLVLGEAAPRSIGNLAEATVINLSTMMRIVQRMERDGLVATRPGLTDARVTDVSPTSLGLETLAAARRVAAPIYEALVDGLSEPDFDRLLSLLGRLQANLDGYEGD
jgi:DNA-binding MarR family transcriptional regulator